MRIAIATLGCKVNQFESRALEEALEEQGHEVVTFGEPADAVVVNSCAVTHRSDRDTRALARRARRVNPGARIVVTGCYAQVDPEGLRELGVDAVVGTGEKFSIPELIAAGARGVKVGDVGRLRELSPAPIRRFGDRTRAFLKVQDGCDAYCAYCIVPYARGPSRSLPLVDVRAGLSQTLAAGRREVVFTGVHLGLWGRDLAPAVPLTALLDAGKTSGIPRVRLSSLEQGELTSDVLARMAGSEVLCPHLHVPLQSGCDRVLAAMGRPYGAARFRSRVTAALDAIPGLCLGLDVIVGFPGEDDAAFSETKEYLEELPFAYLHVFPFSPRRATRAFDLPGRVSPGVIRERARVLRELGRRKTRAFWAAHLDRVLPALAEGESAGGWLALRTRNYIRVRVPWAGPAPADEVRVRLESIGEGVVTGRCVESPAAGG